MTMIPTDEKKLLRELAKVLKNHSESQKETKKAHLWTAHNDLHSERPMVFCDPENGWNEIITQESLLCKNDIARGWEFHLRREIFWAEEMKDDKVITGDFVLSHTYTDSGWGMEPARVGGEDNGAYTWISPISDYSLIKNLKFPSVIVNEKKTGELYNLASDVLGDILNVKVKTQWWWTLGLTGTLADLRGLEQILFDMYDYPDELHELMNFLCDGTLNRIEFLEKNGLLSSNTGNTYVGSGGFGFTEQLKNKTSDVSPKDMWGFAESQETGNVSPEMFNEFIFPYHLKLLEKFGLNCYGCCEPLDSRWDYVKAIPNLRRVSVSPWAGIENMAEKLDNKYVYSFKPNPSYLAIKNIDEDLIRETVKRVLKNTNGKNVEFIMKDNHTLANNPRNATRWVEIVKEEIN